MLKIENCSASNSDTNFSQKGTERKENKSNGSYIRKNLVKYNKRFLIKNEIDCIDHINISPKSKELLLENPNINNTFPSIRNEQERNIKESSKIQKNVTMFPEIIPKPKILNELSKQKNKKHFKNIKNKIKRKKKPSRKTKNKYKVTLQKGNIFESIKSYYKIPKKSKSQPKNITKLIIHKDNQEAVLNSLFKRSSEFPEQGNEDSLHSNIRQYYTNKLKQIKDQRKNYDNLETSFKIWKNKFRDSKTALNISDNNQFVNEMEISNHKIFCQSKKEKCSKNDEMQDLDFLLKNKIPSESKKITNISAVDNAERNRGESKTSNLFEYQTKPIKNQKLKKVKITNFEFGENNPVAISYYNNFRYKISGGNNSNLVKTVFSHRFPYWECLDKDRLDYNFRWEMWSKHINYYTLNNKQKQLVNHYEFNYELTTKDKLFKNVKEFCDHQKLDVFDYLPLTFTFDISTKEFNYELDMFCQIYQCLSDYISSNKQLNIKTINKKLCYISSHYSKYYGKPKLNKSFLKESNLWILKPTGFNRGIGVSVFNNLTTLQKLISNLSGINDEIKIRQDIPEEDNSDQKEINNQIRSKKFIIQKYIECPLLFNGRKFDIRMWGLIDHEMKVYIFKEGYLRTSSKQYSIEQNNTSDVAIHLTNNAVQKNLEKYGEFEEGNQVSFDTFQEYLDNQHSEIDFREHLYKQMKQLVFMSTKSIRNKLHPSDRYYSFEILGYDFIIDINYKVWLIEVNTTPCLEESSKLLQSLIPRMLNDTFRLTIDKVFKHHCNEINNVDYPVRGYNNSQNLFDFVCDLHNN